MPPGTYHASIADAAGFVKLVWEATVAGTGGYYLEYRTKQDAGLPDALFSDDTDATLRLIFLRADQVHSPGMLYGCNNCAVVGENTDNAASTLYAQARQDGRSITGPTASVPALAAGTLGFELSRRDPSGRPGTTARTAALYNTLTYRIGDNQYFKQSHESRADGSSFADCRCVELRARDPDCPVSRRSTTRGRSVPRYERCPIRPRTPMPASQGMRSPTSISTSTTYSATHSAQGCR